MQVWEYFELLCIEFDLGKQHPAPAWNSCAVTNYRRQSWRNLQTDVCLHNARWFGAISAEVSRLLFNSSTPCWQNRYSNPERPQSFFINPLLPSSADAKIHFQHPPFQPHSSSRILQSHPTTRHPCRSFSLTLHAQPATRAPTQPQLPRISWTWLTGPKLSRHLGILDNSHVSATAHQDPSYTEDIQKNRTNRTSPLKPFLHRSVNRIWTAQSSLSLASNNHRSWKTQSSLSLTNSNHWVLPFICHTRHPQQLQPADWSTPPTIIYQFSTQFWQTASMHQIRWSIPTFCYTTCKAPIFNIFHLHQFRLQLKR